VRLQAITPREASIFAAADTLPAPELPGCRREACGARSGRDWMVSSGVLRIDAARIGPRGHAVAAALLATHPIRLWLGYRRGSRGDR